MIHQYVPMENRIGKRGKEGEELVKEDGIRGEEVGAYRGRRNVGQWHDVIVTIVFGSSDGKAAVATTMMAITL